MTYKNMFDEAFKALDNGKRRRSDSEFAAAVRKRARSGEPREYRRPHRLLNAAGAVAGAAAVLAGAVFGLKYLGEHGGLKGPDVQGGAGYHEVTSAAYAADNTQESKDILDAVGDVLRFDGLTATIEQVDFDGRFLRVIYSVADYEEYRENAAWVDMSIVAYDTEEQTRRILCGSRDTYDVMTDQKENVHRNYTGIKVSIDKGETMELTFGYDKLETADSDPELVGRYTLTGIDKSQNSYTVYDAGEIDWITMSPLGVMISSPAQYGCNEDFAFGLIFRDGETINIIDLKMDEIVGDKNFGREKSRNGVAANVQGTETANQFEMNNGNWLTIIESLLPDPIDVNDIAAVIINGGEIPLNVYTGMELDGAKELLAKNGIGYEVSEEENADIPVGCVIRTEPEIGLLDEKPEKVTLYTPLTEKETSISVQFLDIKNPGEYKLLYYIDDEIQSDLTETIELSETKELVWNIKGSGVHRYKLLVKCLANQAFGELYECTIDFTKPEPEKDFSEFNAKTFKELAEHENGDVSLIAGIYAPGEEPYETEQPDVSEEDGNEEQLPDLPEAVSTDNDFYNELLAVPIRGDEAWELVKQRGGIDLDYPFPYDRSLFTFTGRAFVLYGADCDVTALAGGTVEFADWYRGWGKIVLIHDENGHYWLYSHLAEELNVGQGDTVETGGKIGHTGSTGMTNTQCYMMHVG